MKKDIKSINRSIINKEIECIIKIFQKQQQIVRSRYLQRWILPNTKRKININISKLLQKMKEEGTHSNTFRRIALPLYQRQSHYRKTTWKQNSHRNISKLISAAYQGSYIVNEWDLSLGCKNSSICANKSMWY